MGPADAPDRYELVERRAAGGEGEVWRARELHGEESFSYAVKLIDVADTGAERQLDELRFHAALATHLEHPALVKVREVFVGPPPHPAGGAAGAVGQRLYFVMKWIEGQSLQEALERGQVRGLDVLAPLEPIAEAIDYLHSGRDTNGAPVIHRDIKPANILVAGDGRVYLVDFGLVRLRSTDRTSRIFGTAPFMAPESLARGEYTPATDRYTLGATVYYALTGEAPVPGDAEGMTRRMEATLGPGRDREIRGILAMLAVSPDARPGSAAAWLRALRNPPMETSLGQPGGGLPPTAGPGVGGVAGSVPTSPAGYPMPPGSTSPAGYPMPPGSMTGAVGAQPMYPGPPSGGPTSGVPLSGPVGPGLSPVAGSYLGAPPGKPKSSNAGLVVVLSIVGVLLLTCCWGVYEIGNSTGNGGYGSSAAPTRSFDKSDPPPPVTELEPALVSVGDISAAMDVERHYVDSRDDLSALQGGLTELNLCAEGPVSGYAIGAANSNAFYVGTEGYPIVASAVAGFYADEAKVYMRELRKTAERCGWNEMQIPKLGQESAGIYVAEGEYTRIAIVFVRTGKVILEVAVRSENGMGGYQAAAIGVAKRAAKRIPKSKA